MPIDRSEVRRMIERMDEALSIMERNQQARHDAEDREMEEDCYDEEQLVNPLDAPQQPSRRWTTSTDPWTTET